MQTEIKGENWQWPIFTVVGLGLVCSVAEVECIVCVYEFCRREEHIVLFCLYSFAHIAWSSWVDSSLTIVAWHNSQERRLYGYNKSSTIPVNSQRLN